MGTDAARGAAKGRRGRGGENKGRLFHNSLKLSGGWEGRYYRRPFALVISIHKLMI